MGDIIENLNKKEIRPLQVPERTAVYVYCNSYKGTRQLTRFGEVAYTSQKAHYSLIYMDTEKLSELVPQLEELKFVKKVRIGRVKELNKNFSDAFIQTNLEIKGEFDPITWD